MYNFEHGSTRGADEGSSSSSYAAITKDHTLEVVTDGSMEPERTKLSERRMEKVPLTMRQDEKIKGYFDPKVVSIGPYHHGKEELQIAERVKPIVAQLYIKRSGRDMDEFRRNIREIVDVARSYYLEGSTEKYSDEEFAEIMLLDGLFVLACFESDNPSYEHETFEKELYKHLDNHALFFLEADIGELLENQLPFQVLELLMSLKLKDNNFAELLDEDWENNSEAYDMPNQRDKNELRRKFRDFLDRKEIDRKQLLHYPEYMWFQRNKFFQSHIHVSGTSDEGRFWDLFYSFRSISELKAKGIRARRGSTYNQRDIKFRSSFFFFAVLEIPPILLNPHFPIHFSNQIAYELTPNNPANRHTMAYINFLKSLINSAEDVKELRANNILLSPCTSDEEVVHMIDSIPTIYEENFTIYAKVKQSIQNHCDNKAKTWIAELVHNYFNSPWAFIAFFAASALIIMTLLQTYFTINPHK
ncbi:hypothetical protein RHSIM_Rhsim10G0160600 [Rhododendron simsii]|uniref:Uncharacterized protein n=1 Tax=Rhododendron simsii TaxID=118357 RepID=A0A834GFD8_RHOSS|nr:hypothetical protein RHSIM_Rhsim10G0160600 [Rhododendron simsii]